MIDENKLIEKFRKYHSELKPRYVSKLVDAVILDLIDIVNEQPKVGEWIPCSERLPVDEYENAKRTRGKNATYPVLATVKAISYEENKEILVVKKVWFFEHLGKTDFYDSDFYRQEVIAWQPLPEPYKEGE